MTPPTALKHLTDPLLSSVIPCIHYLAGHLLARIQSGGFNHGRMVDMITIHITHNMRSICIRSTIKIRHTFESSRFFPFLSSNENIAAAAIFSYLHTSRLYRDRCCVSHGLGTCSNCAQTPSYTTRRWLCNIDRYRHPETFSFAGFVFVGPRAFPPPLT